MIKLHHGQNAVDQQHIKWICKEIKIAKINVLQLLVFTENAIIMKDLLFCSSTNVVEIMLSENKREVSF